MDAAQRDDSGQIREDIACPSGITAMSATARRWSLSTQSRFEISRMTTSTAISAPAKTFRNISPEVSPA
ncbi:hypothetical protein CVN68_12340 [Sphingomonas psychrotolerans]|uniref:Uncharacterized protein n=1 Tax=Sphingomonas psychrotolerans TaxID=1327635 RepID=A0A2K8MJC1_9SPHN|nr:hypothetical protein CVN68_12340 [Sphingomonas psychrotolerans]